MGTGRRRRSTGDQHVYVRQRLAGVTTAGLTESRTTDDGGRETRLAVEGRQLSLTYDSDDHVTRVSDGTSSADFSFDASGRRVSVTSAGQIKRFLTAPNAGDGYESPQALTDANGALIASYVFAGETPLAKSTASGTQYYLTDALGSVIATSSGAGALVASLDYDAFGNERTAQALAADTHGDFRLHGMWKDPSGLYYVRARVYEAETARFTSRDRHPGNVLAPESANPYIFANSNPLQWSDPTGLFTLSQVGAAITAAVSNTLTQVASFALYIRAARIAANGLKLVQAARTLSAVALISAQRKSDILIDFMRRINFTIQGGLAKGVRDAGPFWKLFQMTADMLYVLSKRPG